MGKRAYSAGKCLPMVHRKSKDRLAQGRDSMLSRRMFLNGPIGRRLLTSQSVQSVTAKMTQTQPAKKR